MGLLNTAMPLYTDELSACSVIVIASTTHVFGTHCSRGSFGPSVQGEYIQPVDGAKAEAAEIVKLYTAHKKEAGSIKAMIFSADQAPTSDDAAAALRDGLVAGGIDKIDWFPLMRMLIITCLLERQRRKLEHSP